MKKAICAALCLASLTAGAAAYQVPYANGTFHVILQPFNNNDPEAQAEMLKKLGLFLGTSEGFELERAMTRAEAAAMLCRFLGGAADSGAYSHPFDDVPDWASPSIGWLYQNQLTYGISDGKYGSDQPVTADQFARFLSRALSGSDHFANRMLTEREASAFQDAAFQRQDAVAMSVRALEQSAGAGQPTLAQQLIEKGVFTAEQFSDAAWDVINPCYLDAQGSMAGVVFADRSEDGFQNANALSASDCALPYLYATRMENGQNVYYQLDCKTLAETSVGTLGSGESSLRYFTTLGDTDYLWERLSQPVGSGERLLAVKDGKITVALDESAAAGASYPDDIQGMEGIPIRTLNGGYILNRTGVHPDNDSNRETVWSDGAFKVTQEVTSESTVIALSNLETGETLQSYSVEQDRADAPRRLSEQSASTREGLLYGEAGLYIVSIRPDGAGGQRARLIQLTSEPVIDYTSADRLSNAYYVISHDPGERISGHSGMGGTKVIAVSVATDVFLTEEYQPQPVKTIVGKELGIHPVRIEPNPDYVFFDLYTEQNTGMGYHGYTYRYSEFDHRLTVIDYTHTYAQELPEWVESDPEAYKKPYMEREQARIDAIQGASG